MDELEVPPWSVVLRHGRFEVLTADAGRGELPIREFLARIRAAFGMDVVFVSTFEAGRRRIRFVDADPADDFAIPEGASDPLEESYCHHIVEGRLPQLIACADDHAVARGLPGTRLARVGSHLAVPIVTADGRVYGTVCCFSHDPQPELGAREELEALREVAVLLGEVLAKEGGRSRAPA